MSQRKSLSGMKLGKLSGLGRRVLPNGRGGQRAMTEALEGRKLFAVSVVQGLGDVTLATGVNTNTALLAGTFATDTLGGGARAYNGSIVEFVIKRNSASGPVVNTIDIELDDLKLSNRSSASATVKNFLNYVTSHRYDSTVFHRSLNFTDNTQPAQFLQGGSFVTDSSGKLSNVATDSPIALDFQNDRPNISGTIAMARSSDPNSATSGFFFNTIDNSDIFNSSNAYAVFGQVIGNGQQALTDLSSLKRISATVSYSGTPTPFDGFPVSNYPSGTTPGVSNYVTLTSAIVKDQLTYQATSSQSSVVQTSISADGVLTLTRPNGAFGTSNVTVTATDLSGNSSSYTFAVTALDPKLSVTVNNTAATTGQATTDFGSVLHHQPLTATLGLSNGGNTVLNISALNLPAGYSLLQSAPATLDPGASASLTLVVDTSVAGIKSGNVVIPSDDPTAPSFTLPVTANVQVLPGIRAAVNGVAVTVLNPAISQLPEFVKKGPATATLKLSNTSSDAISVTSIDLPAGYSLSGTLPQTIDGNGSVDLTLTVDTSSLGVKSGNVIVHSTDAETPALVVPITATVSPSATIGVAVNGSVVAGAIASVVELGRVSTGTSVNAALTLTNKGVTDLIVSGITPLAGYSVSGTFPLTIAPKASVNLTLTADTSTPGVKYGNLYILSTDDETPAFKVPVSTTVYKSVLIDNKTIKSIVFTESDGTKGTLSLTGVGRIEAQFIGSDVSAKNTNGVYTLLKGGLTLDSLLVSATNSKSVVTLKSSGKDKQIALGTLYMSGAKSSVGTLDLAPAVLGGTATLAGGVGGITLAGLSGGNLTIGAASVGGKPRIQLALGKLEDGFVDVLTNALTTISASSSANTEIVARSGITSLTVSGTVSQSQIEAGTSITALKAGRLLNSVILAGTAGAGVDGTASVPTNKTQVGLKGTIGSVTVTSSAASSFSGTVIAAAKLGNLSLGSLATSSTAASSSIIANLIDTFAGKISTKKFSLSEIDDSKSLAAALKSAKVTLPKSLTVTVY